MRHVEVWCRNSIPGAISFAPEANIAAISGRELFLKKILPMTDMQAPVL
jgi:hypothetical protein